MNSSTLKYDPLSDFILTGSRAAAAICRAGGEEGRGGGEEGRGGGRGGGGEE